MLIRVERTKPHRHRRDREKLYLGQHNGIQVSNNGKFQLHSTWSISTFHWKHVSPREHEILFIFFLLLLGVTILVVRMPAFPYSKYMHCKYIWNRFGSAHTKHCSKYSFLHLRVCDCVVVKQFHQKASKFIFSFKTYYAPLSQMCWQVDTNTTLCAGGH